MRNTGRLFHEHHMKSSDSPVISENLASLGNEKVDEVRKDTGVGVLGLIENKYPEPVLSYLHLKNKTIQNDYKDSDGQIEHCGLIAMNLAKLFMESGKTPFIMRVNEQVQENTSVHSKHLKPLKYNGKVTWGAHWVCCCGDEVFDPIVDRPIKIDQYTQAVFGEKINMEILIPENRMREFVGMPFKQ